MGGGARWVLWLGLAIAAGAVATLLWNEWQLAGNFEALARAGRSLAAADGQVVRLTGEAKGSAPARPLVRPPRACRPAPRPAGRDPAAGWSNARARATTRCCATASGRRS
ncbi:MAG: hypothetical protein U1E17_09090 [Geminicoccaceae bacterium]